MIRVKHYNFISCNLDELRKIFNAACENEVCRPLD